MPTRRSSSCRPTSVTGAGSECGSTAGSTGTSSRGSPRTPSRRSRRRGSSRRLAAKVGEGEGGERGVRFETVISDLPPSVGFDLPFDPKATFGKVRAPVRVTINGHEFRTTVMAMGGRTLIGLSRAVQEAAGVKAGDRVTVEVLLDEA